MNTDFTKIVNYLKEHNLKISTMESCTGGGVVNAITNVPGASSVLNFSAVTYSNQFKIKMGVDKEIIDKYTVYSMETAKEMSKKISNFTDSDYGVGVTGKLRRMDENNLYGEDDIVFISIYSKRDDKYYTKELVAEFNERVDNKNLILSNIIDMLNTILGIK